MKHKKRGNLALFIFFVAWCVLVMIIYWYRRS